jgi:hypothetical protein
VVPETHRSNPSHPASVASKSHSVVARAPASSVRLSCSSSQYRPTGVVVGCTSAARLWRPASNVAISLDVRLAKVSCVRVSISCAA